MAFLQNLPANHEQDSCVEYKQSHTPEEEEKNNPKVLMK